MSPKKKKKNTTLLAPCYIPKRLSNKKNFDKHVCIKLNAPCHFDLTFIGRTTYLKNPTIINCTEASSTSALVEMLQFVCHKIGLIVTKRKVAKENLQEMLSSNVTLHVMQKKE